jgi:hypothetical protein
MPDTFYDAGNIKDRVARLEALRGAMWSERASFDAHWREIADFMVPRRGRFNPSDRNKGDKRNQNIIDSTGRFASRTLSSGLHAGMTSPARPWFKLSTHDPDLMKDQAVKEWLQNVTRRMLDVFLQTNLYNTLPIVYGDMGLFATGCMSVLEDQKDVFRCYPYPVGSYVLGMDRRGVASTFARDYVLSVRQVIEEFGLAENGTDIDWTYLSNTVKNQWQQGNYEAPVQVCWLIQPNPAYNPNAMGAKHYRWLSCHWEKAGDGDKLLRESGFKSFPILAPRWDITGEDTYGTDCPGMTALGDVKQLQIEQRKKGTAINKMIDPPLQAPTALRTQKTSLFPGDITYVDVREGAGVKALHEVTINIEHLGRDIYEVQSRINKAFYVDLFLMLAARDQNQQGVQPFTAREVDERHEEKLLGLGPVLERTSDELHEPLIDRTFTMLLDYGFIPKPPPQLEGLELKIEYLSIMAAAQKLVSVVGLDRFVGTISALVAQQVAPEVTHKVDWFQVADIYADLLGVDLRVVRPTEEAEQRQQEAGKAQQAIAEAQQAKLTADAMKSASQAPMTGDTALTRAGDMMGGSPGTVQ